MADLLERGSTYENKIFLKTSTTFREALLLDKKSYRSRINQICPNKSDLKGSCFIHDTFFFLNDKLNHATEFGHHTWNHFYEIL